MGNQDGVSAAIANLVERIRQHRFNGYTESMIAAEIDKFRRGVGTNSFAAAVDALQSVARSLESTDHTLREQLAQLGVDWQGKAAGQAGATLGEHANSSGAARQTIEHAAEMIFAQGEAFNRTKNKLPDAETITSGAGGANLGDALLSLIGFETDHAAAVSQTREAKQQAVEALNEYARNSGENLANAEAVPDLGSQPGDGQTAPTGAGMRGIMPEPVPTGGGIDPLVTGEPGGAPVGPTPTAPSGTAPPAPLRPTAPSAAPPAPGVPDPPRPPSEAPAPGPGTGSSRPVPEHTAPTGSTGGATSSSQSAPVGGVVGGVVGRGGRPSRGNPSGGRPVGGTGATPPGTAGPPAGGSGDVVGGQPPPGNSAGSGPGLPGSGAPTGAPGSDSFGKPGAPVAGAPAPGGAVPGAPVSGGKPDAASTGVPGSASGKPDLGGPPPSGGNVGSGKPDPGGPPPGGGGTPRGDEPLGKGKTLGSVPVPPSAGNASGATSVSVPKPGPSVNDLGAGATAVGAGGTAGAISAEPERRGRGVGKSAPHAGTSRDSLPFDEPDQAHENQPRASELAEAEQDDSSGLLEPAAPPETPESVRRYGIDDHDLFTDQRMVGPSVLGDSDSGHTR